MRVAVRPSRRPAGAPQGDGCLGRLSECRHPEAAPLASLEGRNNPDSLLPASPRPALSRTGRIWSRGSDARAGVRPPTTPRLAEALVTRSASSRQPPMVTGSGGRPASAATPSSSNAGRISSGLPDEALEIPAVAVAHRAPRRPRERPADDDRQVWLLRRPRARSSSVRPRPSRQCYSAVDFVEISRFIASICSRVCAASPPWSNERAVALDLLHVPAAADAEDEPPAQTPDPSEATDFSESGSVSRWITRQIPVASFSFLVTAPHTASTSRAGPSRRNSAFCSSPPPGGGSCAAPGCAECSATQIRVETALFECDGQLRRGDRVVGEKDRAAEFHLSPPNAHLAAPILGSDGLSALAQRQRRQSVD